MPYRRVTRQLTIAYASAVCIIAVLLIVSQIIIQWTLYQEAQTRDLASTMALQELRTQAVFRNALLAILPDTAQRQFNSLGVNPVKSLQTNLVNVEATNKQLISIDTPAQVSKPMQQLQPDFEQMDNAAHQVLTDIQVNNKQAEGTQVGILWIHEQKYLIGTYNAYTLLTGQADALVVQAHVLELFICSISLLVLGVEVLAIIRPAIDDYNKALDALEQIQKEPQI